MEIKRSSSLSRLSARCSPSCLLLPGRIRYYSRREHTNCNVGSVKKKKKSKLITTTTKTGFGDPLYQWNHLRTGSHEKYCTHDLLLPPPFITARFCFFLKKKSVQLEVSILARSKSPYSYTSKKRIFAVGNEMTLPLSFKIFS